MEEWVVRDVPVKTNVLVVGAGPTGLVLATALAAAGVSFVVVDKVEEGGNYSRAVGTLPRTLEMVEGLGIAERMSDTGMRIHRIRMFSGDHDRNIATLRLDKVDATPFPYSVTMPQHRTEELILGRLRELGGDVHRPFRLAGLAQDGDGVTATLEGEGGEVRTVRAAYAVGADGVNSAVRKALGVSFPGDTFRQQFVLSDMRFDGARTDEIHLFFSRQGCVIMGPMPGGLHRVCMSVDRLPGEPLSPEEAQELLDERLPVHPRPRVKEVLGSSHTSVHHRIATRFRVGRVLLAGDAAHTNSPIIGQRMNLGMQDGVVLGSLLAATVRGGDDVLDVYEETRRPQVTAAVENSRRMNGMATERNRWKGALRDTVLPLSNIPTLNRAMVTRLAQLGGR